MGFNNAFIRFLPNSQNRNNEINTGSFIVTIMAVVTSLVYLVLVPYITPELEIIRDNFWYSFGFIIIVSLASINSLTDSIFIAYRSAQYSLITNGFIISIAKLLLPLLFVGFGAYGIFASAGFATSIGMLASIIFLIIKFNYRPKLTIDKNVLKKVFQYSSGSYISNLLNVIPTLTLPIIVINHLGAPASAYYFLTFMLVNLLYTVAGSVSQSLFAEGSYGSVALRDLLKKSLRILLTIMIPAGVILAVFGPFVLNFFGKSYGEGGSSVLVMLAIASPAVAAYSLSGVILRIRNQMRSLIFVNLVYAITIIGLTLVWIDKGLVWVAVAWMVGNLVSSIVAFVCIFIYRKNPTPVDIPK
jgi:O-antigen/teichoic acid export membrane protein